MPPTGHDTGVMLQGTTGVVAIAAAVVIIVSFTVLVAVLLVEVIVVVNWVLWPCEVVGGPGTVVAVVVVGGEFVLVVVETLDGAIIINVPVMAVGWFSQ